MGRKRSTYICPKCGVQGSLRSKWTRNGDYNNAPENWYRYVEHFNSSTKRKSTCYVDNILRKMEYKMIILRQWDYILARGFERIELMVKKSKKRIEKMLQLVTDSDDRVKMQGLLESVRDLIYYERVPGLLVLVLSNKGNLNEQEEFLLIESKKLLSTQAKIKQQIKTLKRITINKHGKPNIRGKGLVDLLENSIQALHYIRSPFFVRFELWYKKYGKPIMDKKRLAWKKKLSEGMGKYPNQYSGIV